MPTLNKELEDRLRAEGRIKDPDPAIKSEPSNAPPDQRGLRGMQAKGRLKSGELNKTEQEFQEELERRKHIGTIKWYRFHPFNLRLANGLFYRPDVLVLDSSDQLIVYEVKGFWTDDAVAKVKVAADTFPFAFIAVSKEAKKRGGGWKERYF